MSSVGEISEHSGVFRSEQRSREVQIYREPVQVPGADHEIVVTAGYRRWLEFDEPGGTGQDYSAVRAGLGFAVGVVADGVSQSFYGDLAARAVGEFLFDHLWEERESPPGKEKLEEELERLCKAVAEQVAGRELPPPDTLLGKALRRTREEGSQAVFAAFVLDAREEPAQLHLYQVGDVLAWVYDESGQAQAQASPPRGRWSSTGRSDLMLTVLKLSGDGAVRGVVLHSDGLPRGWAGELAGAEIGGQDFEKEKVEQWAARDDVSFAAAAILSVRGDRPRRSQREEHTASTLAAPPPLSVEAVLAEGERAGSGPVEKRHGLEGELVRTEEDGADGEFERARFAAVTARGAKAEEAWSEGGAADGRASWPPGDGRREEPGGRGGWRWFTARLLSRFAAVLRRRKSQRIGLRHGEPPRSGEELPLAPGEEQVLFAIRGIDFDQAEILVPGLPQPTVFRASPQAARIFFAPIRRLAGASAARLHLYRHGALIAERSINLDGGRPSAEAAGAADGLIVCAQSFSWRP
ncbi:MAG: protein phosphatase 2C domain-containing protein [Acidobacteriota bacterium]|nr:protein phosphatase 2C domain-containing protein [Acidobacteriota bacterium]